MAEKIAKAGVKREKGWLYYLDKQGDVSRAKMARGGSHSRSKPEKIAKTGVKREEGYLYFVGRKDHVIKTRGEKVHPKEVENILYSMQGVKEAAVVGVPDEVLGHVIKAIVVADEGVELTEQDVLRHCSRYLEEFKVPRSVAFRERLPKTTNGKIAKRELAEAAEAA